MKFSYDLFEVQYTTPPELENVEKKIENLEKIWNMKNDWDQNWESRVKHIKFKEFNMDV